MGIGERYEFEKTGRIEPEPKPESWLSIAVWPDTIRVGHVEGKNETEDIHESQAEAEHVCTLLRKRGYRGDGKVLPLETRVEPIFPDISAPDRDGHP